MPRHHEVSMQSDLELKTTNQCCTVSTVQEKSGVSQITLVASLRHFLVGWDYPSRKPGPPAGV